MKHSSHTSELSVRQLGESTWSAWTSCEIYMGKSFVHMHNSQSRVFPMTIENSQNTSKCDHTIKQYQINWHFYVKAKLVSFSLSWTLLIVIDPTMSVSFFLFLIVKSALWALQGMTIQKMASRDLKQTANQHQRHENSMYVYIYEHMYTCIIITDWKKVITMDSFIINSWEKCYI